MLKNVTCDEIWKTTKFYLPNKIKYFNCNQRRIKKKRKKKEKKNSLVDKFLKEINISTKVKRE